MDLNWPISQEKYLKIDWSVIMMLLDYYGSCRFLVMGSWYWPISHFRVTPVSKWVLVQNLSYEDEFDLYEKEPACRGNTYFIAIDFARKLGFDTHRSKRQPGKGLVLRQSPKYCLGVVLSVPLSNPHQGQNLYTYFRAIGHRYCSFVMQSNKYCYCR